MRSRLRVLYGRVTTPLDAALALVLATAACYSSLVTTAPHPHVRAVLAAVTALWLLTRSRHPVFAAAGVSVLLTVESLTTESPDEVPVLLVLIVSSYSLFAHATVRRALVGYALLIAAVAVSIAVDPSDSTSNIASGVAVFIVAPAAIGFVMHRRGRDLATLERQVGAATQSAEDAVEDERRRIARELHDVVSHAVTLIAVQAEAGQAVIERDWRAADRSLQAIGQASRDALGELDRMLGLLRLADAPSGDLGLRRLPALLDGARSAGMRIDVERSGTPFALRDAADLCAYRVIQEAITNALRHARGSTVTLGFGYGDDALELTIMSEGESHASAYGGTGRGLVGLDERVRSVGGTLSTTRDADRTFTVHARIPNDADRLRP